MSDIPGPSSLAKLPFDLALGVLSAGVRQVRELPETAAKLPVRGLNYAFLAVERAQREYRGLQQRGEALLGIVASLAGRGVSQLAEGEAGEAGIPSYAEEARREAAEFYARVRGGDGQAAPQEESDLAEVVELAPEAVEAGAPGAAEAAVERAEAAVGTPEPPAAAELPIADYDHLSIGSLRSRLPRLELAELVALRAYELAHANRLPVRTMIENRIAKVEAAGSAPATAKKTTPAKKAATKKTAKAPAPDANAADRAAKEDGASTVRP